MNFRPIVLVAFSAVVSASQASAGVITYNFQLNAPNGYPVTDLVLYAAGAGQDDVYLSPVELPSSGVFQLTQTVDFDPTDALLLGITERDKDNKWDIIMFTSDAYATAALGYRFNELFPPDRNPRHSQLPLLMQDAHSGDLTPLDTLTAFLRGSDAAAAYLDPHGSYSIIQFTEVVPPIGGAVPEPASLAIFGLGTLGIAVMRRRRKQPA